MADRLGTSNIVFAANIAEENRGMSKSESRTPMLRIIPGRSTEPITTATIHILWEASLLSHPLDVWPALGPCGPGLGPGDVRPPPTPPPRHTAKPDHAAGTSVGARRYPPKCPRRQRLDGNTCQFRPCRPRQGVSPVMPAQATYAPPRPTLLIARLGHAGRGLRSGPSGRPTILDMDADDATRRSHRAWAWGMQC